MGGGGGVEQHDDAVRAGGGSRELFPGRRSRTGVAGQGERQSREHGDEERVEMNYPRALFTTTGAINLMRDGIPGKRFVDALLRGILEIVPYELGRDIKAEWLRDSGYAYICIYDRDG